MCHFLLQWIFLNVKMLVAQLSQTLCDPMDCSPSGFSVHGIFQARILEWFAISFSRGSSPPRIWTWVSCIAGRFFNRWAIGEIFTVSHSILYIFLSKYYNLSLAYILFIILTWNLINPNSMDSASAQDWTIKRSPFKFMAVVSCGSLVLPGRATIFPWFIQSPAFLDDHFIHSFFSSNPCQNLFLILTLS